MNDVEREYSLYQFSKTPVDESVHVSYDQSVIGTTEPTTDFERRIRIIRKEEDERIKKALTKGAKTMQHKCAERKNKLAKLIRDGNEFSLEEASIYLDVSVPTIRKYLKDMNLTIPKNQLKKSTKKKTKPKKSSKKKTNKKDGIH